MVQTALNGLNGLMLLCDVYLIVDTLITQGNVAFFANLYRGSLDGVYQFNELGAVVLG